MTPVRRKLLYAISFETLGVLVAALGLLLMSDAGPASSFALALITATVALCWNYLYNTAFEAWEARQTTRGRSFARRTAHAIFFEIGLVLMLVPIMAWWLGVGLRQALAFEAGLIALFLVYTWAFTWAFDRIFGLPASAR